ncbi:MAG: helix-turn-helix domain-containing protein [Halobacteriota archaeon]
MSLISEITLTAPEAYLGPTLREHPEVVVKLEEEYALDPDKPIIQFWATGPNLDAFEESLATDPTVSSARVIEEMNGRRLYHSQVERNADLILYRNIVEAEGVVIQATASDDTWHARIRFPDREALQGFRKTCKDLDVQFALGGLYSEQDPEQELLTPKQREALRYALKHGYYDVPRRTSVSGLAEKLGISSQAVSERLRRAHATLARRHVGDSDNPHLDSE